MLAFVLYEALEAATVVEGRWLKIGTDGGEVAAVRVLARFDCAACLAVSGCSKCLQSGSNDSEIQVSLGASAGMPQLCTQVVILLPLASLCSYLLST